ncbi:50S ribosomal protein L18 [Emcibacter sp. SYSU 3D8]|uniref:50S ribosomal protein L18 n=1 Tax=Emcibacter sp. SYSU 3D8 TaxID=3133969 RepID=UPI0031FEDDB1
MNKRIELFLRRQQRVRNRLRKSGTGRVRLAVHRSGKHIYAQVIDDREGRTVASASTLEKDFRGAGKSGANVDAAREVGTLIAKRAVDAGIKDVMFDRSGFLYHGRIKALADAAREGGLNF